MYGSPTLSIADRLFDIEIYCAPYHKIIINQRWSYEFHRRQEMPVWHYLEKIQYKSTVSALIHHGWSGRFHIRATSSEVSPEWAKEWGGKLFDTEFRIENNDVNPHWRIRVNKVPDTIEREAWVYEPERIVYLDARAVLPEIYHHGAFVLPFRVVPHEFGHMIGNLPWSVARDYGDEYRPHNMHNEDKRSIMNIGSSLRARHFRYVIERLNASVLHTQFKLS